MKVTCIETGITYQIEAIAASLHGLPVVHPLAFPENVHAVIEKFRKEGKLLYKLDARYLAGMSLTLLRSLDLMQCKNPIEANKFLSTASPESLTGFINWLFSLRSVHGFPQISLLSTHINHNAFALDQSKSQAECLIESFMRSCPVEKTGFLAPSKITPDEHGKRIKVFTDKVRQQAREVKEVKSESKELLEALMVANADPSLAAYFQNLKTALASITFLNEDNKRKLAVDLLHRFPQSKVAEQLAYILRNTKTDALAEDMLGFSSIKSQEKNIKESGVVRPAKIDLMSIGKKVG